MGNHVISSGNAVINERYDNIEVIIPSRKKISRILLLPLWLLGWFAGELFVGAAFLHAILDILTYKIKIAVEPLAVLFILLWLAFWTTGGIMIIRALLVMFFGKQIIKFSPYEISITDKIGWIGKERLFEMTQVRDFQIAYRPEPKDDRRHPEKSDRLLFIYEDEKIEFGKGMNREEMESLIELLKKYLYLRQGNLPRKDLWEKKNTWRKKGLWKAIPDEEDHFKSIFKKSEAAL